MAINTCAVPRKQHKSKLLLGQVTITYGGVQLGRNLVLCNRSSVDLLVLLKSLTQPFF
jgi:hypothetical protein